MFWNLVLLREIKKEGCCFYKKCNVTLTRGNEIIYHVMSQWVGKHPDNTKDAFYICLLKCFYLFAQCNKAVNAIYSKKQVELIIKAGHKVTAVENLVCFMIMKHGPAAAVVLSSI